MQTIKVNIIDHENGVIFAINGKVIATICKNGINPSRYNTRYAAHAHSNNMSFVDAVEFIGDKIEASFASLGLNVEFVNA